MKLSFLQKDACIAIGLMSGTSADGIDAAVVELRGCGTDTRVRQLGFITLPFSDEARQKILQVAGGAPLDSREICLLNFYLGDLSAEMMDARRISVELRQKRRHRLEHFRRNRRRCIVIEINDSFLVHFTPPY